MMDDAVDSEDVDQVQELVADQSKIVVVHHARMSVVLKMEMLDHLLAHLSKLPELVLVKIDQLEEVLLLPLLEELQVVNNEVAMTVNDDSVDHASSEAPMKAKMRQRSTMNATSRHSAKQNARKKYLNFSRNGKKNMKSSQRDF
jgi:hypothetical protein